MNKNAREILRAIEAVRSVLGADHPAVVSLSESAERLYGVRKKPPKPKAPGPDKEARRLERGIRLKVAVDMVTLRAAGACEVCGRTDLRLELDHLVSGGLRRHRESSETLLLVCCDCHRAKHRNDRATLRAYVETCIRLGMREGKIEMERRLAKLEEARRAAPF